MDFSIGRSVPAYCTALGKVFLANLPERKIESYCQGKKLKVRTQRTITSPEELKRHLDMVRVQGFAIDNRELDNGTRCIAAPLRDDSRKVIAAISIAGPAIRLNMEKLKSLSKPLIEVTERISRKLGYQS